MLNLTESDEGKTVVDQTGTSVGVITTVESGRAYVEPAAGVPTRVKHKLDWHESGSTPYELKNSMVHSITDTEIKIRR